MQYYITYFNVNMMMRKINNMKCILSITLNCYGRFIIRYGECNYQGKQFRVKVINSIFNYTPIHSKNSTINDWDEIIGYWLLQN